MKHVSWIYLLLGILIAGCTPTIKVEAPDKPIQINVNVKIDHEIRIKVDKDLEKAIKSNSGIF